MKHPTSRELFAYWNEQRGSRPVPDRTDIEPGAIRSVLGDTFILDADRRTGHPFRLAGTRVCALFCRELKSEAFAALWDADEQDEVNARIGIVAEESTGLIAGAAARNTNGAALDLELLLLPLASMGEPRRRIIGMLIPFDVPYWIGVSPLVSLTLGSFRHLGAEMELSASPLMSGEMAEECDATSPSGLFAARSLPSMPLSRLNHGLRVYEGGRAE